MEISSNYQTVQPKKLTEDEKKFIEQGKKDLAEMQKLTESAPKKHEYGLAFTVNDYSHFKTHDKFTTYGIRAEKEVDIIAGKRCKFAAIGGKQITFNSKSIHFEPGLGLKFQIGSDRELIRAYTTAMGTLNFGVLDGRLTGGAGLRAAIGGEVGPLYAEGFAEKATNFVSHGINIGLRVKL